MAFTYGFYNSLNGDRKYNAFQMTQMFDGIILDGVFEAIGQHFAVTASEGMTVNVGTGRAWFNHTWNDNDSVMPITLPLSDLNRSRYDAIVIEVGDPNTDRTNAIKVVSGEVAVNPVKPTLNRGATNNDTLEPDSTTLPPYQHALAYILVKPGVEAITAADIEIVVGKDETPFVTGPIETRSIEELFNQWDAQFNTWFSNLKAQLTDNVVTNLQGQIDSNREAIEENFRKTLLEDTKNVMHLGPDAIPDAAFKYLLMRINAISKDLAIVTITAKDKNGLPARGVEIQNLIGLDGTNQCTDDNGIAFGYAAVGATTFKISGYGDLKDATYQADLIQGEERQIDWLIVRRNYVKINASQTLRFTSDCPSVSFTIAGGGGGGGSGYYKKSPIIRNGGGGGGGGRCVKVENRTVTPGTEYPVVIGTGGSGYSGNQAGDGYAGGASSFMGTNANGGGNGQGGATCDYTSNTTLPNGVPGGSGNGKGGRGGTRSNNSNSIASTLDPTAGLNGSEMFYTSYTEQAACGGGGGGGQALTGKTAMSGGSPYGGAGGGAYYSENNSGYGVAANGIAGGGGGGGCVEPDGSSTKLLWRGGSGYAGSLGLRMHLSVAV